MAIPNALIIYLKRLSDDINSTDNKKQQEAKSELKKLEEMYFKDAEVLAAIVRVNKPQPMPVVRGENLPPPPPPRKINLAPSTAVIQKGISGIADEVRPASTASASSTSSERYSDSDFESETKHHGQETKNQHANYAFQKPNKVNDSDLQKNGLLLTNEQIIKIQEFLKDKPDDNRYGKKSISGITLPFGIMKVYGELYAVYHGQKKQKHLGDGAFGKVKLAQKLTGVDKGKWHALKVLYKKDPDEHNKLSVLKRAYGKHFSRTTKSGMEKFHILMDLAPGVELWEVLGSGKSSPKDSPSEQLNIADAVLDAVDEIHEHLLHFDLKPENLFWDSTTKKITILDFGFSKWKGEKMPAEIKGTPLYIAPEMIKAARTGNSLSYGLNTDYYAVGRIFQDIFGFPANNYYNKYPDIEIENPFYISSIADVHEVKNLCDAMTDRDPAKRLTDLTKVREQLNLIREKLKIPKRADFYDQLLYMIDNGSSLVAGAKKESGKKFKFHEELNSLLGELKELSATSAKPKNLFDLSQRVIGAYSEFIESIDKSRGIKTKMDVIPTEKGALFWKGIDNEAVIRNTCKAELEKFLSENPFLLRTADKDHRP
jgi:serine/threonine protein kinase